MSDQNASRQPLVGNPAFVYRLACDTITLGYIFCIVPVVLQNVLVPAGSDYLAMTFILILVFLPGNAFVIFFFDKWTPRVLRIMGPSVIFTLVDNTVMFVVSCFARAGVGQIILFLTNNIIFLLCNFNCASVARSTKENILLFWNIDQPIKEKPATYVALLLVAAMIAACLFEWRLVYLFTALLVLVLPVMVSRVQRAMKTRLAADPGIAIRYSRAFTAQVFSRITIAHVAEKFGLSILYAFIMAAAFSSPMLPVGLDVIFPGSATLPLYSTMTAYVLAFIALGSPLMILFWLLMRRYHAYLFVREKIAAVCLVFAIIALVVPAALGDVASLIPLYAFRVWVLVNDSFFAMEMLYIFLIIFDFIPSKRVEFIGQILPILIGTIFFLWIFSMADTLGTNSTFFVLGIVAACLLLLYYLLLPRVRSRRLHDNTRKNSVT